MKRNKVNINKLKSQELRGLFQQTHSKDFFPHVRAQALERALDEERLINFEKGKGVVVWKLCKQKSTTYNNRPGDFKIEYIVVDENYLGKGISSSLFKHCIELAKSKNCPRLILTVRDDNKRMQKFVNKMGMKLEFKTDVTSQTSGNVIRYRCYYMKLSKTKNFFG